MTIPLLFVPYLNTEIFKHEGVTWEWGLAAGMAIVFMLLSELWKVGKRYVLEREPQPKACTTAAEVEMGEIV